eukprot:g11240.t1
MAAQLLEALGITEMYQTVRGMDRRQLANQALNLGLIITSAVMMWKGLVVASGSESPVVVVLSGSMEPAFFRGDILFLWQGHHEYEVGEIIVYKLSGKEIPIVHRIIEVHHDRGNRTRILTKGDNNPVDDRGLYQQGQLWLEPKDVMGRAKAFLPYAGMVTIQLTDYPALKYLMIGLMGIFVITSKEQKG